MSAHHLRAASTLAALAVVACGCTVSAEVTSGTPTPSTVPASSIASDTAKRLAEKFGAEPDSVVCAGGLRREVGATQRCTLTKDGDELGMTITATAVNGDGSVDYDVKVDER
ncbi:DUF4333 domain-containing protein [Tsukamurella sp. 1534]|uniref:DUF4333 domain-containing protein n=1 Tax=Tsukamurella sp. 1534 TaxID=1151061 RepID=UPI00030E2B80|nr:DUF4333 domain-containing protein [Tsukamurella sp. 1534]